MTDTHHHRSPTTVVEDRSPMATAMVVIAVILLAVFLVWLVAFSGVVFDGTPDGTTLTPDQNTDAPPVDSGGDTGGTTETDPGSSP